VVLFGLEGAVAVEVREGNAGFTGGVAGGVTAGATGGGGFELL